MHIYIEIIDYRNGWLQDSREAPSNTQFVPEDVYENDQVVPSEVTDARISGVSVSICSKFEARAKCCPVVSHVFSGTRGEIWIHGF